VTDGFNPFIQSGKDEDESYLVSSIVADSIPMINETLPGGADVGSMFHDILEEIDYKKVLENSGQLESVKGIHQLVINKMNEYSVDIKWEKHILSIVSKTLGQPIQLDGNELILGNLPSAKRVHEVEFHFPFKKPCKPNVEIPGFETHPGPEGFLRGFIDLIFLFNGKYYLADWKSNILENGYGRKALSEAMSNAGYELQYKLYVLALIRWLRIHLNNELEINSRFGGVLYFFIR